MMFLLHLLLASLLAALLGVLSPLFWLLAFVTLYGDFRLLGKVHRRSLIYARRLEAALVFVPWFIWQVFHASFNVARIVLSPGYKVQPAVVAVPIQTRDRRLITLIGCLLTLTPGTLALDCRARTGDMFVHVLDTQSTELVVCSVGEIERRLMRWVKPSGGKQ